MFGTDFAGIMSGITNPEINARVFLKYSTDDLWNLLKDPITHQEKNHNFIIIFDDGEKLECSVKETIFSSYFWEFHREFPNTPLIAKHHLRKLLGNGCYTSNIHIKLTNGILWDVYDNNPGLDPDGLDILANRAYKHVNTMYNAFVTRIEGSVSGADILDFIELIEHPKISHLNSAVEPTEKSFSDTYAGIVDVLRNDPTIQKNEIVHAWRSRVIKENQLLQCIGPRGFLTDIDSVRFNYPIMTGYVRGFNTLYDSMIESRSAAKALLFSKKTLQDTEYFNRRLQLIDMIVRNVHPGDCGSEEYLLFTVRGPRYENGIKTYNGDLELIAGKWYVDDDGVTKLVRPTDTHLINSTLKLRTVYGCKHTDPYGICSKCMGEISLAVYRGNNVGHQCCVSMTRKSSQGVLSTKHLDGTSVITKINIEPRYRKYLDSNKDGDSYLLNKTLKGSINLIIKRDNAYNLSDINNVTSLDKLNIGRVSSIEYVGLEIKTDKMEETMTIDIRVERRNGSFTYEMLEYIQRVGYNVDSKGNYIINMDSWDKSIPIIVLPQQQYDMGAHSKDIADMLESKVSEMQKRDKFTSWASYVLEAFDVINSKLGVNLALIEVITLGTAIVSAEEYNYALPKPWTQRGFGVKNRTMAMRSLSATMAYQNHHMVLTSPYSFLIKDRPDHIFDAILMPRQVIYNTSG